MKSTFQELQKKSFLIDELSIAVEYSKNGLSYLQNNKGGLLENYFTAFLLLSTGIERYIKVILCLHSFEHQGKFKSEKELRNLGHDIVDLKEKALTTCFISAYLNRPAIIDDYDFLKKDEALNKLLTILSDFAIKDRYMFLNGLSDPNFERERPETRWVEIERQLITISEKEYFLQQNKIDEYEERVFKEVIIIFEKFLRALARTITLSDLSPEVKSLGTGVWDFLMIMDKDLGTKKY